MISKEVIDMADNNTLINAELNDDDLLDISGGVTRTSGGNITTVTCGKCGTVFEIDATATRYKCPNCKAYRSRGTNTTSKSGTKG